MPALIRVSFWLATIALAAWLVANSWMRWMDPFIDFGREVYLPWRVLCGEHPGRDFIHPYGPLSVYVNAGLFAVFGVSVRTLAIANLAIFSAIVVALFTVARRGFGYFPAAAAALVCVAVFGFEHYWGINNYTYAAPYSHEATHGMLLLLGLLLWLTRPGFAGGRRDGVVAGALVALCCLTKTEYVPVVGALWLIVAWRLAKPAGARGRLATWLVTTSAGFGAVVVLTWLLLSLALGPVVALKSTFSAIVAPVTFRAYSTSTHVLHFLGADRPAENFITIAKWAAWTGAVGAGFALLAFVAVRAGRRSARYGCVAVAAVFAGLVAQRVDWVFCGSAFPALLALGAVWLIREGWGRGGLASRNSRWFAQVAYFVAAIGLLARMAFDPTISHYGFFQAMLAATWLTAFLVGAVPVWGCHPAARTVTGIGCAALIAVGATMLVERSVGFYRRKQTPIGSGPNRILAYDPNVYPLPQMWEKVRQHLGRTTSADASVLVIPEGLSLNFWTRRKHPLPISDVLPATLRLLDQPVTTVLEACPPEVVVLVSREMAEFGFSQYGEDEQTRVLIEWVAQHYAVELQQGGYPMAPPNLGIWVLRRKQ